MKEKNSVVNSLYLSYMKRLLYSDENNLKFLRSVGANINTKDLFAFINTLSNDKAKIKGIKVFSDQLNDNNLYSIVNTFSDDSLKIECIETFGSKFNNYNLSKIIQSLSNDQAKIDCLKMQNISSRLNDYELFIIINNISNDQAKIDCLKNLDLESQSIAYIVSKFTRDENKLECLKTLNLESNDTTNIIKSFSDDQIKIDCLKSLNLETEQISNIITTLSSDKAKIDCIKNLDLIDDDLVYIITSFSDDINKINCLNYFHFNSFNNANIIASLSEDQKKLEYIKNYTLNSNDKTNIIASFNTDILKLQCINNNNFNLTNENIVTIISSINDLPELIFNAEISDELFKIILSTPSCLQLISYGLEDITTNASKTLYNKLNELVKTIEPGKSISNLLTILSIQAKENFDYAKINEPNKYLPSNIAEIIVNEIGSKTRNEIQEDYNLISKKTKLTNIINKSFDIKALSSLLEQINKDNNKNLSQKIDHILNTLNIRSFKEKDKNIIDEELKNAYKNILLTFTKPSIEEMINSGNVNQILNMIKDSTKLIVDAAFYEENNRKIGNLLTKVCTFTLDAQQKKAIDEILNELKNASKKDLILTKKSLETIYKNRVLSILKEDVNLEKILTSDNINYSNKMKLIFNYLYPYYDDIMNLQQLYLEMKEDIKYKERILKPITIEETKEIPLTKENFEINEKLQKQRVLIALLSVLNANMLPSVDNNGDLSNSIIKRINEVENGIIDRNNGENSKGIELLCNNLSDFTNKESLGYLLIFYKNTTDSLKKSNTIVKFNADNLNKYIELAQKKVSTSVKEKIILGDKVCEELDTRAIKRNYLHYIKSMARRTYRTIPNISGKVNSNGNEIQFRSYDVDDPEQLIAGTRIKSINSCFKLGGAQSSTFKYITSSPHGTIIVVEDKDKNFLGRIYGYRIGNAVHFTRMYYNTSFDFEKTIYEIGKSIINESNEIEYVTALPKTCLNEIYIHNEIKVKPIGLKFTQEDDYIYTDHDVFSTNIVARKNERKIKFNRNQPTERFYKKRTPAKIFNLKNATEEEKLNIQKELLKFNYLNDNEIKENINNNSKVIIGDGWYIIIPDNRLEPIIEKIHYNDEYVDKIIFDEMKIFLEKIKLDVKTDTINYLLSESTQIDEGKTK